MVAVSPIVKAIDPERHLAAVIALGRANKKTLGLFPDEAFARYAAEGRILVAVSKQDECLGYLLYDRTRGMYVIVHLCVLKASRQKGLAEALGRALIALAMGGNVRGIGLKCRLEYLDACRLWQRLGFVAQTEVRGRSKAGHKLVCWWKDLKNRDLFSTADELARQGGISAVVDANVFFDMMAEEDTPANTPSRALRSDWLSGTLHLCVVGELFNEFLKAEDEEKREANRSFASQHFSILRYDGPRFDQLCTELRALFSPEASEQDESDLRQLAGAIAADASFFVTRDGGVLRLGEAIYDKYRLNVLRPAELITRLDESIRVAQYEPVRFAGASISMRLPTHADRAALVGAFQNSHAGETKEAFVRHLDCWLAQPSVWRASYISMGSGRPLALLVEQCAASGAERLGIPMLRVARDPLSSTLAYQLVKQAIMSAVDAGAKVVAIEDKYAQSQVFTAADYFGFFRAGGCYCKLCFPVVAPGKSVAASVQRVGTRVLHTELAEWGKELRDADKLRNAEWASMQEHLLWPAKLADASIPCYLCPVRPPWAVHLFDEGMAKGTLFGRERGLALNVEAAFYSGAPGAPKAPARVMWYVSGGRGGQGGMRLRACSRLLSAETGGPKELYKKHKHLGIYSWAQVYEAAHNDLEYQLTALRFDDTELFRHPMHWDVFQPLLRDAGVITVVRRPTPLASSVFLKLYEMAVR